MSAHSAYLALGSNLGAREETLCAARGELERAGFQETRRSSLYLTEPVGGPTQDWFLNQVLAGGTALDPRRLLAACLEVELVLGRVRGERDAPRTLDVDLLFFDDLVLEEPGLSLPHPRLHARRFVLVPLEEIAPDLVHPQLRLTVRELLARCPDRSLVLRHAPAPAR